MFRTIIYHVYTLIPRVPIAAGGMTQFLITPKKRNILVGGNDMQNERLGEGKDVRERVLGFEKEGTDEEE